MSWNSEAGRVRGRVTRLITTPIKFKGYTVHASKDEPQYELKSETLATRMRDEPVAAGSVVMRHSEIGAWARV